MFVLHHPQNLTLPLHQYATWAIKHRRGTITGQRSTLKITELCFRILTCILWQAVMS
ncbi:hypothetical protein SCLCIDRAFT_1216388 [Scleroderma citrinum Foug A]|uniref:Uncharacterized protein n=1 Tax=Scleroderma citrinum Foug A TaxID=1036808 RepID=A0A0C3DJJ4_9AGAM|nr:hypothetical protein SCLCIDRAFT_1216388 [Scleroderma citrinum Foug A]